MPELPEVETVRRGLSQLVIGKTIKSIDVLWPKIINGDIIPFKHELEGRKIESIDRLGKYLLFRFDNQMTMVSHLRMEGKYFVRATDEPIEKHSHVIFHLTDGQDLRYNDVRKFGRMQLIPTGQERELSGLKKLGPEPIENEFKLSDFKKYLARKHMSIKPVLLNQEAVAGLGNIYVDEVLWMSKINPEQPANSISDSKLSSLRKNIILELATAVQAGGTTIRSYTGAFGETGLFQFDLNVYGQTGKPCPRCGTPIAKIKVAQRGTHYCPHCQPLRKV
ncbi:DNA-formamidopyrimidine glycosylase [Dellaglioa algida]|uniref:Formamidopyrimidine-DNA glycosylase n=1 Tax=Dellaglioa algida TaxID=105612 RepID=A0A5C6M9C0_9LACO|nr:DNA-formamidopyrimidine glycosylase [Dellaglioa algida]MDK1716689.1 DNA-formamidopyrimidine glycosylase [Dellaglioa algida]MDK1720136.1 DNA-formamidopyrimidine glycosylase [Dellaglioa algida]MDK1721631.1 DNA-formamidopyrimidine glycosylase [Dellaglioa algida]MDK1723525.1 DNA-formamidopyrimidine glycosylase [Dellaglioa algida]MDK1725159.1 DNA-formamidopyrimidine glycosylase [Dellaglioa algida]